jgi:DivIVA domain-containing protein
MEATRSRVFSLVRRGYDPQEVVEYLSRVAGHVKGLEDQVGHLEEQVGHLHARLRDADKRTATASRTDYDRVSRQIATLMRSFEEDVDRMRRTAESEAEAVLAAARADADKMRLDAQAKAEEMRADAHLTVHEADELARRIVGELRSRRAQVLDDVRAIRDHLLATGGNLDELVNGNAGDLPDDQSIVDLSGASADELAPGMVVDRTDTAARGDDMPTTAV